MERELTAIDPRLVLRRGYSYTTNTKCGLIRSVRDVKPGQQMVTHVADGSIESRVGRARRRRPRRKGGPSERDQMDLFGSQE